MQLFLEQLKNDVMAGRESWRVFAVMTSAAAAVTLAYLSL
jgi:hypothetical protein